jgi:uncharacterized protein (DUF1015 family)
MADKKLIIADGHHRYETALNFERECRGGHPGREADCGYAMMTFVNMEGDGIVILPTHRLVKGVEGWSAEGFLNAAEGYFTVRRYTFASGGEWKEAGEKMRLEMEAGASEPGLSSIGAVFHGENAFYRLRQREDIRWDELLPGLTEAERSLDVNILHRIALGVCLGMDEESVRKEKYLTYVRQFEDGADHVLGGRAQACFFLSPAKMEQVRDIAFSGRVLPQKSTDFYPKLLSGLVLYPLEH